MRYVLCLLTADSSIFRTYTRSNFMIDKNNIVVIMAKFHFFFYKQHFKTSDDIFRIAQII